VDRLDPNAFDVAQGRARLIVTFSIAFSSNDGQLARSITTRAPGALSLPVTKIHSE